MTLHNYQLERIFDQVTYYSNISNISYSTLSTPKKFETQQKTKKSRKKYIIIIQYIPRHAQNLKLYLKNLTFNYIIIQIFLKL